MKNARKIIAILMSVFFVISLIPTMALADDVTMIAESMPSSVYCRYSHVSFVSETSDSAPVLGGRADKSAVFNVGEIPSSTTVAHTVGAAFTPDATQNYTFEMGVYFDGNAFPAINAWYDDVMEATVVLKVDGDGYLCYNENGTVTKTDMKLSSERWHRIVIYYEASRGRYTIYVNGEYITNNTYYYGSTRAKNLWIGVASHSYSGRVAYDDFEGYYGTYSVDADDAIVTNGSDDLIFDADTKTIKYDSSVYTTSDAVVSAVKTATSATYANFVDDDTIVFTSPNGNIYSYWTIRALTNADAIFASYYGENGTVNIRNSGNYKYTHITYSGETTETLGGKAGTSYVLTVGEIPSGQTVSHTSGMKYTPDATKNYTFETSVYFDGNAYPSVSAHYDDDLGASTLIKVGTDGYVYYNNNGVTTKSSLQVESGQWHRMVVEFQQTRGRFALYFDGTLLTDNTSWYNSTYAGEFWIGTAAHSYNGKVAYADFTAYYDAYTSDADDAIVTTNSADLIFNADTKTITYNKYVYSTTDALIAAVKTAAGCTYASLLDNDTLVFTSPNGKSYAYYTIKEMTDADVMMSMTGLSSNSNYVYVLDSSIGVVSNNLDGNYYTDSAEVIAALSSSTGYTLTYVDADKNELEDVDATVTDGFIKAVNGENVFYIPVETKGKVNTDISVSPAGTAAALDNDRSGYVTVSTSASSAIGGKAAEDIDYVITSANVPSTAKACTVGLMYKSLPSIPTTFEMNVYMDGDAEFAFNGQWEESAFEAMRIEDDGTIVYDNNGSYVTAPNKVETGKWHRVAITYDASRGRCIIYVDGNLITDATRVLQTKTVMLGAGGGTTNGTVAIADFESYYGYYNYIDLVRAENGKITASVDADLLDGECFFALAEYADGEMVNLAPATVTVENNTSVSLNYNADSIYRAFLWKNDASAPIATSVLYR